MSTRTRLRLAAHRFIDSICIWLVGRDHCRTAEYLWRACRMY